MRRRDGLRGAPGSGQRRRELGLDQMLAAPIQKLIKTAGTEDDIPVLVMMLGLETEGVCYPRHHARYRSHPEADVNIYELFVSLFNRCNHDNH